MDRPILFSAPMVRALLDGRKTQTRRVLKNQPPSECSIRYMLGNESWKPDGERTPLHHHWEAWHGPLYQNRPEKALCGWHDVKMPYVPGDRLYVREAWRVGYEFEDTSPRNLIAGAMPVLYEADAPHAMPWPGRLRQGMHMPRWASRLTLTVTDVRVQRLQEISEEDAQAEGVERVHYDGSNPEYLGQHGYRDYRDHPHSVVPFILAQSSFQTLWDSLNADRNGGLFAWSANPWICAISFRCACRNIDEAA